jgi:hypothetical protein
MPGRDLSSEDDRIVAASAEMIAAIVASLCSLRHADPRLTDDSHDVDELATAQLGRVVP